MRESKDLDAVIEAAWASFRGRLADHIAAMDDDDVLIVEFSGVVDEDAEGSAPYVQLCAFGEDLVQVEAASNHYLDESYALSFDDECDLLDLGWEAPRDDEDGWDNFNRTFERRCADEIAVLAVRTLRQVYAVPHPSFLTAGGLEVDPEVVLPTVREVHDHEVADETDFDGIPDSPEQLRAMVEATMTEVFPDLKHDDDGDIPIVTGSSVVYVRTLESRPCVELYSEIVIHPEALDRLAQELVLLNAAHPLWKFALRDEQVVMTHEVMALPYSSMGLRLLVKRFVEEVDQIAGDLVVRVGGRRFLEPKPVEDARDLVMTGLLELLHLDRVRPTTVAGLFEHDRREIIRQIVRIRSGQQSCDDLEQDYVLTALRKALRLVSDGEPPAQALPPRPRRRSVQEPLLEGLESEEALDLGWSA